MPESDQEADAIARRKFKIKFWENAGGELGTWGVRLVMLIIAAFIAWNLAGWFLDWLWSPVDWLFGGVSDAASSVQDTAGSAVDAVTGIFSNGDNAETPAAEENGPGFLCSKTGYFCGE